MTALTTAIWIILLSSATAGDWTPVPLPSVEQKCFHEAAPIRWEYCVNVTAGSRNRDLVYHFHGRNGDATWWNDQTYYSGRVTNAWKAARRDAPTVVTISFGKLWLLTEPAPTGGGLYAAFLSHAMQTVEANVPRFARPCPRSARKPDGGRSSGICDPTGLRSNAH